MTMAYRQGSPGQAVAFFVPAGAEKEGVRAARGRFIAECQCPKTIDHHGPTVRRSEQALEFAFGIKRHDGAAAEVANQEVASMFAEGIWRKSYAPWRINFLQSAAGIRAGGKTMELAGLGIQNVDQSVAAACDIVACSRILFGEGHENEAVNILDIERRIARRRIHV